MHIIRVMPRGAPIGSIRYTITYWKVLAGIGAVDEVAVAAVVGLDTTKDSLERVSWWRCEKCIIER